MNPEPDEYEFLSKRPKFAVHRDPTKPIIRLQPTPLQAPRPRVELSANGLSFNPIPNPQPTTTTSDLMPYPERIARRSADLVRSELFQFAGMVSDNVIRQIEPQLKLLQEDVREMLQMLLERTDTHAVFDTPSPSRIITHRDKEKANELRAFQRTRDSGCIIEFEGVSYKAEQAPFHEIQIEVDKDVRKSVLGGKNLCAEPAITSLQIADKVHSPRLLGCIVLSRIFNPANIGKACLTLPQRAFNRWPKQKAFSPEFVKAFYDLCALLGGARYLPVKQRSQWYREIQRGIQSRVSNCRNGCGSIFGDPKAAGVLCNCRRKPVPGHSHFYKNCVFKDEEADGFILPSRIVGDPPRFEGEDTDARLDELVEESRAHSMTNSEADCADDDDNENLAELDPLALVTKALRS